jgi:hypothetical protein
MVRLVRLYRYMREPGGGGGGGYIILYDASPSLSAWSLVRGGGGGGGGLVVSLVPSLSCDVPPMPGMLLSSSNTNARRRGSSAVLVCLLVDNHLSLGLHGQIHGYTDPDSASIIVKGSTSTH